VVARRGIPRGVLLVTLFFAVNAALELLLSLAELPWPLPFWPAWEALGRALLHVLLAAGLWQRKALCRPIAWIYCVAALATHLTALGLALGGAPFDYPTSLVVKSLFEVPSAALLLPWLGSPRAAAVFDQPLVH